jgi:3-deoxy-D-manno-octulosonic-acid transferase
LIISVYRELKKDFFDLNLIIAPRHPERFQGVEDLLRLKGISFIKRSEFRTSNPPNPPLERGGEGGVSEPQFLKGEIILLDTLGELSAVYGMSDIAIIGKSYKGYGGQNPLEPAYWGKAIICGPHMENFPVIQDFYDQGAALEANEESLYLALRELLYSPEKVRKMGDKAKKIYTKNTGAVDRAMEVIIRYIR